MHALSSIAGDIMPKKIVIAHADQVLFGARPQSVLLTMVKLSWASYNGFQTDSGYSNDIKSINNVLVATLFQHSELPRSGQFVSLTWTDQRPRRLLTPAQLCGAYKVKPCQIIKIRRRSQNQAFYYL